MEKWINLEVFNGKSIFNTITIVYLKLLQWSDPFTYEVFITKDRVESICKMCELSKASFYRALQELVKQNIISYDNQKAILLDCNKLKKQGILPAILKKYIDI